MAVSWMPNETGTSPNDLLVSGICRPSRGITGTHPLLGASVIEPPILRHLEACQRLILVLFRVLVHAFLGVGIHAHYPVIQDRVHLVR